MEMPAFKIFFFISVVPGIVLLYIPYKIVSLPVDIKFNPGIIRYAAPFFWIAGVIISLWCVREFFLRGKGTPAPIDPPKYLVVSGLYRYVRNPMYIGILLILSGHIIWFGSLALIFYFSVLFAGFHLFVVYYEEPHLIRSFDGSYKNYLKQVPRWIPRMGRNR